MLKTFFLVEKGKYLPYFLISKYLSKYILSKYLPYSLISSSQASPSTSSDKNECQYCHQISVNNVIFVFLHFIRVIITIIVIVIVIVITWQVS